MKDLERNAKISFNLIQTMFPRSMQIKPGYKLHTIDRMTLSHGAILELGLIRKLLNWSILEFNKRPIFFRLGEVNKNSQTGANTIHCGTGALVPDFASLVKSVRSNPCVVITPRKSKNILWGRNDEIIQIVLPS